ncbi:ABC transporter ATP-binding protein, partial [Micromonospora echinofusca]
MRTPTGSDRLLRRVVRDGGGWTVLLGAVALTGAAAELALPAALGLAVDAAVAGDGGARWPAAAGGRIAVLMRTRSA